MAQASFDAWVKYYRQDENTPNATVSYYTKGSLVALCLDLHLRQHGKATLDDVMRGLWSRCKAGPMSEADLLAVLRGADRAQLRRRDCASGCTAPTSCRWPHLLAAHGVSLQARHRPARAAPGHAGGRKTTACRSRPCCAAARQNRQALLAGDEWLGLPREAAQAWRICNAGRPGAVRRPQRQPGHGRGGARRPSAGLPLTLPAACRRTAATRHASAASHLETGRSPSHSRRRRWLAPLVTRTRQLSVSTAVCWMCTPFTTITEEIAMAYETIEVRTEAEKVGIITLNRPKQLNALNDQLMDELGEALKAFDADEKSAA